MFPNNAVAMTIFWRPMVDRGQNEHDAWQWFVVSTRTVRGKPGRKTVMLSATVRAANAPATSANEPAT
jgi:hypothetical protein